MSTKQPTSQVFIGNIPYGLTEEQIIDIFNSSGKVLNFRMVYDKESGKPKGFGFAKYPDIDSAASAVRNLNGHEVMNRPLRVDFANDADSDDNTATNNHQRPPLPMNGTGYAAPILQNTSSLPPLPMGIDLPPGLTCHDSISRTLSTLPPTQLLDVLTQMKTLTSTDPGKATELLRQAPQLSYAIFQALLIMGLVSTEALGSVIEQSAAQPPPMQQYGAPPPPGAYPPGFPPPPPAMSGQLGMQMGTPSVHNQPYPPPIQRGPPPPQAPQVDESQALIQQVLAMSQEMIDTLGPVERGQIMEIRRQYGR